MINAMYWVRYKSEKMTETFSMALFTVDRYGASLRHEQTSFVLFLECYHNHQVYKHLNWRLCI